ncbi:MAG: hypothetical protein GC206_08240 [Alphaproteobacteria bacterium]|nr:hypothetical protein [Alphaproteobacteria bacterium]
MNLLDRAHVSDALRFWEVGRLPYNLALALTALGALNVQGLLTPEGLGPLAPHFPVLLVLAGAANVLYCAAYPVDLVLQHSDWRPRRRVWRLGLWCAGTLLAMALTWIMMLGAMGLGEALSEF